jgi:Cu-Zn family superoxide dismutase
VGDLGNINQTNANGEEVVFVLEDSQVSLFGDYSVIGRSFVCHADPDDLGRGGFPDSKTTGHAGARLACGVIALSSKF